MKLKSIPNDLVEIREWILNVLKEMKIEPEPLREILADVGLGLPLISDLPECPDVGKEFMLALVISMYRKHNLRQFTLTLKVVVRLSKNEEAKQFERLY